MSKFCTQVKSAGWRGKCLPKNKNLGSSFSRLVGESMAPAGQHCVLVAWSFFVKADQGHSEDMEAKHSMGTLCLLVLLHL